MQSRLERRVGIPQHFSLEDWVSPLTGIIADISGPAKPLVRIVAPSISLRTVPIAHRILPSRESRPVTPTDGVGPGTRPGTRGPSRGSGNGFLHKRIGGDERADSWASRRAKRAACIRTNFSRRCQAAPPFHGSQVSRRSPDCLDARRNRLGGRRPGFWSQPRFALIDYQDREQPAFCIHFIDRLRGPAKVAGSQAILSGLMELFGSGMPQRYTKCTLARLPPLPRLLSLEIEGNDDSRGQEPAALAKLVEH